MSSFNRSRAGGFVRQAFFYVGVFAASTLVAVIARFGEERLGLLWRDNLTRRSVRNYLADGTFHRLGISGAVANPDQRISEDVRAFTVTTLSFAAGGSFFTIVLGRPLIRLNYDQLDKEASFRSGLIRVRDSAEAIMLAREEDAQTAQLLTRLDDLVANFRKITSINRNVGFFTTGYNWMIQIIPALIIAPAFIEGKIEFGVITQSAMAFSTLVAVFSLIVTQFQSLSSFAAVVARLSALVEAFGQPSDPEVREATPPGQ